MWPYCNLLYAHTFMYILYKLRRHKHSHKTTEIVCLLVCLCIYLVVHSSASHFMYNSFGDVHVQSFIYVSMYSFIHSHSHTKRYIYNCCTLRENRRHRVLQQLQCNNGRRILHRPRYQSQPAAERSITKLKRAEFCKGVWKYWLTSGDTLYLPIQKVSNLY